MKTYFPFVEQIEFGSPGTNDQLAYRFYDPQKKVLGKTMAEHLRIAVCYWHTFCSHGDDAFGVGTRTLPWDKGDTPLKMAENKLDAAFEFFTKLSVPFFAFHDRDLAPEGKSFIASADNLKHIADLTQKKMEQTGIKLLWGTANCFSHPRYMAGAATNPDPAIFAYAAAQVKHAMDATKKLGGENYVLWGGREGYDSLLNTDLKHEFDQLGRFLAMVVEHKHKIGFKGNILIEPKPCEPTKHQYDSDSAAVFAFLQKYNLEKEVKLNIEANHATLAGHDFEHEIAYALTNDLFGSVDMNRGDPGLGWDTDQFPNSVAEISRIVYLILKHGGFSTGGFNFDAKVRRQSIDMEDLFYAHIGGIDVLAKSLLLAEKMLRTDLLQKIKDGRYQNWQQQLGRDIWSNKHSLDSLTQHILDAGIEPKPVSGKQELCENIISEYIFD